MTERFTDRLRRLGGLHLGGPVLPPLRPRNRRGHAAPRTLRPLGAAGLPVPHRVLAPVRHRGGQGAGPGEHGAPRRARPGDAAHGDGASPLLRRGVRHNSGGAGARGQGAHVPGLHGLPDSNGGAGKLRGADGRPASVHVGLLRDRPPPGRTGHTGGGALRQVGADVHGPPSLRCWWTGAAMQPTLRPRASPGQSRSEWRRRSSSAAATSTSSGRWPGGRRRGRCRCRGLRVLSPQPAMSIRAPSQILHLLPEHSYSHSSLLLLARSAVSMIAAGQREYIWAGAGRGKCR